ncbi:hypothetical protein NR798_43955 [Archangium gephyra]|uniref:hypothetical protein n=1 Tax=Archangium gephyra TaxID=48 RepID=UPI0035D469A3
MTAFLSPPSSLSLLLLLLLAPGVGLAGQEALTPTASGQPGTQEGASLRLREDDWTQEDARPSRGLRILAETGAGLLTGLGGGVAGAFAGGALCEAGVVGSKSGFLSCLEPAASGLLLGAGAGFALGVWWGGEAAGGDGRLLGALAGFGSCAALGLLWGVAAGTPSTGLLVAIPLSLIGSIVGYELTQQAPASGPQAPAVASARFQPVLAFSSRGALVGLGGSF